MQPLNSEDSTWYDNAVIRPPKSDYDEKRYTRIAIDSKDRDTNSYPNLNKYTIPLHDDIEDIVVARLISCNIPLSGYLINSFHNTISFKIGATSYTAILDEGDYDATALAAEIQSKINGAVGSAVFTVQYVSKTGKLRFSHTSTNFTLQFHTDNTNSLAHVLGFLPSKQYQSTGNILVSPFKVNLDYFKYVVMYIDQFTSNNSASNVLNKSFAMIYDGQSKININEMTNISKTFTPPISRLSKLNVTFFDRDGNPYDFNGVDHSYEILFTSYKQKRKYNSMSFGR